MTDAGYSIGWWIEAADEETYGPVSRATLQRLLSDGVISTNSLVRHCTQEAARPVVDQPGMLEGMQVGDHLRPTGDRMEEFWPKSARERNALAEGELPCVRHKRPAIAVCLRCHAPYCRKCQMKSHRKQFYFCRRCQANHNNRRFLGVVVDGILTYAITLPVMFLAGVGVAGEPESPGLLMAYQVVSWGVLVLYVFRDPLMGGAGPGKRVVGLKVVQTKDGTSPLTYVQALIRFLPLMIPFLPIVEGILIYRDPLVRRLGDRWAGTRVIDTSAKLAKVRFKTRRQLARKGVEYMMDDQEATLARFAQIGG